MFGNVMKNKLKNTFQYLIISWKIIREKQITIIKIRTKVNIKIKLNQILRDEIEKQIQNKIYSNQKFEN